MKKEQINEQYKLSWDETWFLEKLVFDEKMILEIHLILGQEESATDLLVANVNLGPAFPVVRDPSKKVIIRFFQPLTFQRLDESFASEKGGIHTGQRFSIYTESEYLRYFEKVSFGLIEKPIQHYCLTCADDIIDILSCDPPEIQIA